MRTIAATTAGLLLALGLGAMGCSSKGSTDPIGAGSGSDGGSSSGNTPVTSPTAGSCNLALYPSDFDTRCQGALDQACCNEEKACGANADCVKIVSCIGACPPPRQDSCVSACASDGESTPGFKEFDAIATCSKGPAYKEPEGVHCGYP